MKRKNISTHVFRYILDGYRTEAAPYSALTGLKQRSHFGRPDFGEILERHFQDLVEDGVVERKVGVLVSLLYFRRNRDIADILIVLRHSHRGRDSC